jgi:hypothetical protein
LTWHLRRIRRQQLEQDQRTLLLMTAGSAGGKAAQKVWRMLDDEINGRRAATGEESETPRSQEDFERMMQEE